MSKLKWFVKTPRRAIVTVVMLAALVASGYAIAQWMTSVQGPPAKGTFSSLVVTKATPTAGPASANCSPGATCDGEISLNNTSNGPVQITGWTAGVMGNDTAGTPTGASGSCSASDISNNVTIPAVTLTPGNYISVPVGTSNITLPGMFVINSALSSGCQGATFSWTFGSTGGFSVSVIGG